MPRCIVPVSKACLAILVALQALAQRPFVAVVTVGDVEPYAQAVQGIRERLPDVDVWDARDEARLREHFARTPPVLVIAVGSVAAISLEHTAPPQLAMIGSVVLASDLKDDGGPLSRFRASVTIDVPPEALLAELARLFPSRKRIGLIRGPLQSDAYMKAFDLAARHHGLTVEPITCLHPRDLVEAFLQFRSRVDFVWCPPNPSLYTSATLKPLLVASLTNRLPLIGFSEQFVQAGALFGGVADFVDVGRQTAALAARVVKNEPVPVREEAHKFRFAYNQRVAHLLGVKAVLPAEMGNELTVIH